MNRTIKILSILWLMCSFDNASSQYADTNSKFKTEFKYIEDSIVYLFSTDESLILPFLSNLTDLRSHTSRKVYGFNGRMDEYFCFVLQEGLNIYAFDTARNLIFFDISQGSNNVLNSNLTINSCIDRVFKYFNLDSINSDCIIGLVVDFGFSDNGIELYFKNNRLERIIYNKMPD